MDTSQLNAALSKGVSLRRSLELECATVDEFTLAVETLLQYADNIAKNPSADKYVYFYIKNSNKYVRGTFVLCLLTHISNLVCCYAVGKGVLLHRIYLSVCKCLRRSIY